MIAVIFTACLLTSPYNCQQIELAFSGQQALTPFHCQMYGQAELARWVNEHPGWGILSGYKCGRAGRYAKA